ncbi:unnamed protein product [Adineta ricciae]|uniref:TFIIS-type domain-containing protein n=1 Tax=Adineta ricciae TaxID=249248 RepID=A0A814IAB8_ADIRI|nr:unnamed protein product [Adineta ricciae]
MTKAMNRFRAKSMADLRTQAFARPNHSQPLTFQRLCNLCNEVKIKADQYLNVDGDQELAYICYYNATEYLNMIMKCEEYSHLPQFFRTKFEQQWAECEQLESTLRLELEQRYKRQNVNKRNNTVPAVNLKTVNNAICLLTQHTRSLNTVPPYNLVTGQTTIRNISDSTAYRTFDKCLSGNRNPSFTCENTQVPISKVPLSRSDTPQPPRTPRVKPRNRECVVCLTRKPTADFQKRFSTECRHTIRQICTPCVRENTHRALKDSPATEVRCPEQNCNVLFDFVSVQSLLNGASTSLGRCGTALTRHESHLKEMTSEHSKKEHAKLKELTYRESLLPVDEGVGCNLLKCEKCGANNCSYSELQTLSGDEPMTVFALCRSCGHRWRG